MSEIPHLPSDLGAQLVRAASDGDTATMLKLTMLVLAKQAELIEQLVTHHGELTSILNEKLPALSERIKALEDARDQPNSSAVGLE